MSVSLNDSLIILTIGIAIIIILISLRRRNAPGATNPQRRKSFYTSLLKGHIHTEARLRKVNNHPLKQRRKNVILEIEDDGCGFDPEAVDQHGMGLRNMRERASLIGGRFNILSAPGEGTRVVVPISKDKFHKKSLSCGEYGKDTCTCG